MKRFILLLSCLFLAGICAAQSSDAAPPELTIPWIYTHSATGRPPETVKWSPDGTRVSFLLPDSGEMTSLYAIDAATGKQSVLVPAEKIAAMAPAASQTKDDRQSDNRARYNVAGYHWAPGSQHLLFDANGQLWLYSLASGVSAAMSAPGDSVGDPKFSPDGKKFGLMLYPRKTHGIGGSQARIDLFTRIRKHLGRDLLGVQGAKTE